MRASRPNQADHRHMAGAGCQAARRQSVTDEAVVSPPWFVLLWLWVAVGRAEGYLNVFIFILFYCSVLPCTNPVRPLSDWVLVSKLLGFLLGFFFTFNKAVDQTQRQCRRANCDGTINPWYLKSVNKVRQIKERKNNISSFDKGNLVLALWFYILTFLP